MTLPETGSSRDQILSALTDMKSRDLATEGGGAFAYVYASGEREAAALAAQAYAMFLGANGLDTMSFLSLLRMENEIVVHCARHLGGGSEASGSFTSGGTESHAGRPARAGARGRRGDAWRVEPAVGTAQCGSRTSRARARNT